MSGRSRSKASRIPTTPHKDSARSVLAIRLCAAGCISALVLALAFIAAAPILGPSRLTSASYHLVVVVFGLLGAGFLYGAFWTYARSHRRHFGVGLEIGGPAAVLLTVLILGFLLPGPNPSFPLIVAVRREAEPNEPFPRDSGRMVLDLGTRQIRRSIDTQGRAVFARMPQTLLGQEVGLSLESDTYALADPNRRYRLDGMGIDLAVRKKP